jgi:hypothetical protein
MSKQRLLVLFVMASASILAKASVASAGDFATSPPIEQRTEVRFVRVTGFRTLGSTNLTILGLVNGRNREITISGFPNPNEAAIAQCAIVASSALANRFTFRVSGDTFGGGYENGVTTKGILGNANLNCSTPQ